MLAELLVRVHLLSTWLPSVLAMATFVTGFSSSGSVEVSHRGRMGSFRRCEQYLLRMTQFMPAWVFLAQRRLANVALPDLWPLLAARWQVVIVPNFEK